MTPDHPSRGGRLAQEHTMGTGICFFGVPAGEHVSLHSDRQGAISVQVLDHCPDVPGQTSLQLTLPIPSDQPT